MKLTPLDEVRLRAQARGLIEPVCNNCSWFDKPISGDMGECRQRRGETQFKFGICLNWTADKPDPSRVRPDTRVSGGSGAGSGPKPSLPFGMHGQDGLQCAEPGCEGKLALRWSVRLQKPFYGCERYPQCKGVLPANDDGTPRGNPRTRELQGWRNRAHETFDRLWKEQHCTRPEAYAWLRAASGLDHESAHMARMSIDRCKMVIELVASRGPGTEFWSTWKTERASRKASEKRPKGRSRRTSSRKRSKTR